VHIINLRFIHVYHLHSFTNEKLWYKDVGTSGKGTKKKLLPEKYRRLFANKQIVCIEYQDITDDDEREIFQVSRLLILLDWFSTFSFLDCSAFNLGWP
jgi:hypothetical protein